MAVALLQAVVGAHAQKLRYEIALPVRKVILGAGKADVLPVKSKVPPRDVVMLAELVDRSCIRGRQFSKLGMTVVARCRYGRDHEIVNHPAFVPSGLVID